MPQIGTFLKVKGHYPLFAVFRSVLLPVEAWRNVWNRAYWQIQIEFKQINTPIVRQFMKAG